MIRALVGLGGLSFVVVFGLGDVFFFCFFVCCLGDGRETLIYFTGGLLVLSLGSFDRLLPSLFVSDLFRFSLLVFSLFEVNVFLCFVNFRS